MIREDAYNLSGLYIGIVKGYDLDTRRVAVYLPKLMPAISEFTEVTKQTTNISNYVIEDIEYQQSIDTTPFIWVSLMNSDDPMPDVDSRVGVYFIDSQITKGVCFKFNKNNYYNVVPQERHKPIFTLNLNGQKHIFYDGDTITINLPPEYKVIVKNNRPNEDIENAYENRDVVFNILPND